MTLTLYWLRHGQTADSRENVFCGSGRDPSLTAEGIAMAASFAKAYQDHSWAGVYASPLTRALQTAGAITDLIGIPVEQRDELKEIAYGEWEGATVEEVDRNFHDEYVRWTADPAWNPPSGGETAVTISQRILRLVEEITQRVPNGNVLLVSHKATIRIAIAALLGIDVGRFRYRFGCPVASVSVVEFSARGPLLHRLADRAHLDARLRELPGT
ncbi:MAG: histidine phosphatase family protein [Gemmatimonadota bacterium]|nr:histidine phosphatase family protein [Gemmatimonadota bacterium]